ncbi:hypothetical protein CR513_10917, partial [Mucuna pruriens]
MYSDPSKMILSDVIMLKNMTLVDESRFKVFSNPKSLRHLFITKKGVDNEITKWLEFIKDYNFNLSDHLGKVNVVVDTLSSTLCYS